MFVALSIYFVAIVTASQGDPTQVQVRKYTEVMGSTLSYVKTAIDYPLGEFCAPKNVSFW